jgi:hypothetical protein
MTAPEKLTMPLPKGAVSADEWVDVGCREGAWRNFTGPVREIRGGSFVETTGIQNEDASLEAVCVRAQLDVWEHTFHTSWDDMLTPLDARRYAAKLKAAASELTELSLAFEAAADEVDRWSAK